MTRYITFVITLLTCLIQQEMSESCLFVKGVQSFDKGHFIALNHNTKNGKNFVFKLKVRS